MDFDDGFFDEMDLFPNIAEVLDKNEECDQEMAISWLGQETTVDLAQLDSENPLKLVENFTEIMSHEVNSSGNSSPSSETDSTTICIDNDGVQTDRCKGPPLDLEDYSMVSILPRKEMNGQSGLSKNAIAARENRIKKKRYLQELEKTVGSLRAENSMLLSKVGHLETTADNLETEVKYLRNVLANVDEIVGLVRSVRTTPGISLPDKQSKQQQHQVCKSEIMTRAAIKRRRQAVDGAPAEEMTGGKRRKLPVVGKKGIGKSNDKLGGVCLHVNNGKMSLEFCPQCSVSAVEIWKNPS